MKNVQLLIVSGLSGAGKSHVIKALEDFGFYCIDNLPAPLLEKFVALCNQPDGKIAKAALGIDIREQEFFGEFLSFYDMLRAEGYPITLLFVEASDAVLLRRFSETRRPHPLAPPNRSESVLDGIRQERERMAAIRRRADRILDTSDYHVHQLKEVIGRDYGPATDGRLNVTLIAFGYRFGIPLELDLLFDVRFLHNPYFDPALQHLTGEDPRVVESVLSSSSSGAFLEKVYALIDFLIPRYEKEGKSYLTIGVGCTGGRHRSVAITRTLAEHIQASGYVARCQYRDIARAE